MIIGIDGPVGSGKSTLTQLLADAFEGTAALYAPITPADRGTDDPIRQMVEEISDITDDIDLLYADNERYSNSSHGRVKLLNDISRVLMIQSYKPIDKDKHLFIDAFWNTLTTYQPEYLSRFYRIYNQFVPAPDITLFLKIPSHRCVPRAQGRDIELERADNMKSIDENQKNFIEWAGDHIPNFQVIHATNPINDVLKIATDVIKSGKSQPVPEDTLTGEVVNAPTGKKILSFRERVLQRRG